MMDNVLDGSQADGFIDLMSDARYDSTLGADMVNRTDIPNEQITKVLEKENRQILDVISSWVAKTEPSYQVKTALTAEFNAGIAGTGRRQGSLFYRDRYLAAVNPYDQMRTAYAAVEADDVVSGVADVTESLAFSTTTMFSLDEEQQDALNQWAADFDLDGVLRQCWRELFTVSQIYPAVIWGTKEYKVRGEGEGGRKKRKTVKFRAPMQFSLLDPLKVVPVGSGLFHRRGLAWRATREESLRFDDIIGNDRATQDDIVPQLIVGRYTPAPGEKRELQQLGVDTNNLWLLNPVNVFTHTATKAGFQRFSPIRMRSVFELLDLKQQLRQMERAHLIGATNFIVVVTKGSDAIPGEPDEIAHLQNQVQTMARLPFMVGDHRLKVEIVTPKMDSTLKPERWNAIDGRITARLYGMFVLGNYSAGASGDDSAKLVKVVAKGMENKRNMLRRTFERHIFRPMFEVNEDLESMPKMHYHPRAIALDFDAAWADYVQRLSEKGDLSRETSLSEFDFDQDLEAELKKREKANGYDEIFKTQIPFAAPNGGGGQQQEPVVPPGRDNGGGRRGGGGRAPGSGQGQPAKRPSRRSDRGRRQPPVAADELQVAPEQLTVQLIGTDGEVLHEFADNADYQAWLDEEAPDEGAT